MLVEWHCTIYRRREKLMRRDGPMDGEEPIEKWRFSCARDVLYNMYVYTQSIYDSQRIVRSRSLSGISSTAERRSLNAIKTRAPSAL